MDLRILVENQKDFFQTDLTKDYNFRLTALSTLKKSIQAKEEDLLEALSLDLGKSVGEAYMTEVGAVYQDIAHTMKKLKQWMKPTLILPSLAQLPSYGKIFSEPYGSVLIIAPWNYPFLLAMAPLISAISAGNCAVVRPSSKTPHTAGVIASIINQAFSPKYLYAYQSTQREDGLLNQHFDYIFFTGSSQGGKRVLQSAAQNLTPVTLELGGKSPAIIDKTANLSLAAKSIVMGKTVNSGQTCIAPDYLLIHEDLKEGFIDEFIYWSDQFYGEDPISNPDYPRIINQSKFQELEEYIDAGLVPIFGGQRAAHSLKIAPTLLDDVTAESKVMKKEIFGPLLPILTFDDIEDAVDYLKNQEKPLALYLFSKDQKTISNILNRISFGGGCINETLMHLTNPRLPFGGVGNSGMGLYHGKYGFDTFSHKKSISFRLGDLDLPLRYPPYKGKKLSLLRKILK